MIKRPAIRSTVLEEITAEEKLNMHRVIAAGIEADGQVDKTERIYHLAYHFSHTDNHYLAFNYLRQAGELAAENFAFLEAMDFFKQAFDLRSKIAEIGSLQFEEERKFDCSDQKLENQVSKVLSFFS